MIQKPIVRVGGSAVSIQNIVDVSAGKATVRLSLAPQTLRRIKAGVAFLDRKWRSGSPVYGVTTGYGASVERTVPAPLVHELSQQISRFHRCGLGRFFDEGTTRAILLVRLVSLARGYSGVRIDVLAQLSAFIDREILPRIPEEGSVGASGDLTPLSYVAASLMGEGQVMFRGRTCGASRALRLSGLKPLKLNPKEGLALMNGTSVMTALACLALDRAAYLELFSTRISAWCVWALHGNPGHFEKALFQLKGHPGPVRVAARLWKETAGKGFAHKQNLNTIRLQDTYALRCSPHIIGVLSDALPWMKQHVELELNSSNDNPLVDGEMERIYHGGHFYGGHIAFAMDSLKTAVANIADLMDRQMALLVDVKSNRGLPANLSGASANRVAINHGFKAVQIGTSAWTAEALKHTMPASVFSRSTECHNQDKVSLGTIAARDALRVLELTEQVAAAVLLGAVQAVEIRLKHREIIVSHLPPALSDQLREIRKSIPFLEEDRPLDQDLLHVIQAIRSKQWKL
ncbi:MAG: aromatic amino acid lyase [Elusimicrobia bacterium]|jgi:histidine ammonia-lyase|nr:aromatic amino acid lyase [Elusimicrobiota bacterium]